MLIKLLKIVSGDNIFELNKIGYYLYNINHIEFNSDNDNMLFIMRKYGINGEGKIVISNNKYNINKYPFRLARDGMNKLLLNSNCDGLLTIYYKPNNYESNKINDILNQFYDKCRNKHYDKYYKIKDNDLYLIDITNIKYYKDDNEILKLFNDHESRKQIEINTIGFDIIRNHDIITYMNIISDIDTKMEIITFTNIDTYDIKKGNHNYNIDYLFIALAYTNINIKFYDKIKRVEIFGINLPKYLRNIIINNTTRYNIIQKNIMDRYYFNGLLQIK